MEKGGRNNCRKTENKQEDRIAYNQTGTGKKNRQVCTELYFGKQKEMNMT